MQGDFHYYATYCAATLAGYSHEDACDICWSANHADSCTRTFIASVNGPLSAATTQSKAELANMPLDNEGMQDVTRIWASFHFLPRDLNPTFDTWRSRQYKQLYALICGPNSELVKKTIEQAKDRDLQSIGLAMHVLADTWAHRNFAGTPSLVINNRDFRIYELEPDEAENGRRMKYSFNALVPDSVEKARFVCTIFQDEERSVMNLGHGRAGHVPDYSYIRYKYRPAWNRGTFVVKDNPREYAQAFSQMVYALQYLHGDIDEFEVDHYADDIVAPWTDRIDRILRKRVTINCEDWKAFAEELSGQNVPDFDKTAHNEEFLQSEDMESTFLGRYFIAAQNQKLMVGKALRESGNVLVGKKDLVHWLDVPSQVTFIEKLKQIAFTKKGASS